MSINNYQRNSVFSLAVILLSVLMISTGCKKAQNSKASDSDHYYKATIDGVQYHQEVTATNDYIAGSSIAGPEDVIVGADISPKLDTYPAGATSLSIGKGILHNYLSITNEEFKNWFVPGTYSFAADYDSNGFTIDWMDKDGVYWSTAEGAKDQTGSTVKIISVKEVQSPINYYIEVKLQFTCKLYQYGSDEVKHLTNGEFVGLFGRL